MSPKVIARQGLDFAVAEKVLTRAGIQLVPAPLWSEEELIKHGADADAAIVAATEPYTPRVIETLGKCRILSRMGIGYNNIDVPAATRQGIPVAVVLDASVHEVSDQAMAFLLAFARRLFPLAQAVRGGIWKPGSAEIVKARGQMFRLTEQTLGVVGVGRIGGRMPAKARAFGMRVLAYDPYLSAEELRQKGAEKVDFERLLGESDFVTLHTPLTAETRGMFGMKEFRKMKPTAFLINTARGAVVKEADLHQALVEGLIAGAGLDVTEPEPPDPKNPLFQLEQVLVTGHSAFYSASSMMELQQKAAEAVVAALRGEWPPVIVNPEVKEQKNRRIG
jgi:D-3-phosphoglycerate dehydrogenase